METDPQGSRDSARPPPNPLQPVIAGIAAWLVPGLGYWLIGEKVRGAVVGVTVMTLFVTGLLIGGVRVLEVPTFDHNGRLLPDASLSAEVRSKPWSIAQVMVGPIAIVGGAVSINASRPSDSMPLDPYPASNSLLGVHLPSGSESHSRVNEIAVLYTAVAGMLNLLAIIDTVHRAMQMQENS
jgi:hypothetical protein